MIKDNLALTGELTIAINDTIVQKTNNVVVNVGKDWVADRMNNANTIMTHMALGESSLYPGSDAAAKGRAALSDEKYRKAFTTATSVSGSAVTYKCTFAAADGAGAITEAGIFDAAAAGAGDMLARTVFAVVNKGAQDEMTITWTITIS